MSVAALFTIAQMWKQPKWPSTDEWKKKMQCVYMYTHTHTHTYSHKKEQNNAIRSSMDGPRDDHTKWSQSERERQIPHDITYTWDLWHKWTYLQNRNRPKKKITCDSMHDPRGLASTDWSHSQITLSPPNFWCWRRGSCSPVDSPVPQRVTLPLVVEAENGKPLRSKSSPFTSGALGALLQMAPGGSPS